MIIADLLYSATKAFLNADIENPQRNAEILLSYLLDCSIGEIYLSKEIELDIEKFKCSIQQKIEGEPWAYIFNSVQFRNLELKIKKGVFIPRPETELLVEEAERIVLRWLGHTKHAVDFPSEEIMAQVSIGNFSIADTRNWCSSTSAPAAET
ncbi:MAG: hypothetical protein B5M48_03685 [Candidatus Omnitrophica bacterium 4484_213]|nr:MAG: hypothetical protein B5M48_03685 [Candidatus Omnitrophica bacterium 4484_213]